MARYQNKLDSRLAQPKMNSPVRVHQNGSQTSLRSLNRSIDASKTPKDTTGELRMFTQHKNSNAGSIERSSEGVNLKNHIANSSSMVDLSNQVG
mmetsp:Transcript_12157/g.16497  ORF Transcript_12157/g.16497 Transcript_12157/m.16497 type:complete len:94 (+) Transcript_12157:1070-1351(+)